MKTMLISGGTSTIGEAAVRYFTQRGWHVYLGYNTGKEKAEALEEELAPSVTALHLDVQDKSSITDAVRSMGELDLLINNSGIFSSFLTGSLEDDEVSRILDVNVTGLFRLTKAVLPRLKEGGSIINITSINAIMPTFGSTTHYDASKGAVISYTRSLAAELAPRIRVNALAPGLVSAPYLDESNEIRKVFEKRSVLKRMVQSEEVAHALFFMAENTALSGAVITLDCGYTIG
ncbi:MAG: SDR family oxidoreductase [Spirochaetales bacterium]|jgi:NAD(P)-dependent dehydrogenase (short-subunit alcohol dehydrogenase family)|nr:SDR family oxidoreductase [Spirochaetales bacterium]